MSFKSEGIWFITNLGGEKNNPGPDGAEGKTLASSNHLMDPKAHAHGDRFTSSHQRS
jgi:hypothetical protein